MINVIENFNNSLRNPSIQEKRKLVEFFPNIELTGVTILDEPEMKFNSTINYCDSKHFNCGLSLRKIISVYQVNDNKFLQDVIEEIANVVCKNNNFYCKVQYSFSVKYNCIGLALGIIDWINPDKIGKYTKIGYSKSQATKKFIENVAKKYSSFHPANLFDIVNKLDIHTQKLMEPPKNNTVAFYFNDEGECLHAARWFKNFDAWVSKLGEWLPISHSNLYDLLGNNYGNASDYVITSDQYLKQEL